MSTYFLVLISSILVPFLASFYHKMPFYKKWKYFFPAVAVSASFFVAWDMWYTSLGIWGFNAMHLQGWFINGLPVEEILFFIAIPYCCIFTYEAINVYVSADWFTLHSKTLGYSLLLMSSLHCVLYYNKAYPLATFSLLFIWVGINMFILKPTYLGRFFMTYFIVAIPFLLVNGILTGSFIHQEVVWYNENEIMGYRIGTIPFEDYFYGLLLMLLTTNVYEGLKKYY